MIRASRKLSAFLIACTVLLAVLGGTSNNLYSADESSQPSVQTVRQEHLVILHINDTHGRLSPRTVKGRSVGGIARLASLVKQIRQENPERVLLLHAGDVFSRGDAITRHYRGAANFDLMNRIGFDAIVLGNGDYYFGTDNLRQRLAQAKFIVLAGNIFQTIEKKSKPVGQDCAVKRVGPLRIGLLGLSLIRPEDPSSKNLKAGHNLNLARDWIIKIHGQADLVVLLSHLGLPADIMFGGLLGGVNIIVGGHTHSILAEPIVIRHPSSEPDKTFIFQAGEYYSYLGRIDVQFTSSDGETWQVAEIASRLIPINDTISPDIQITKRLAEYQQHLMNEETHQHKAEENTPLCPQSSGIGLSP